MNAPHALLDILADEIKDLFNAEEQLVRALPRFIKIAGDRSLKFDLIRHLEQTKAHAERLREAADLLGVAAAGKACATLQGLIRESRRLDADVAGPARDACLICSLQKIEHYEIAAYGCARSLAQALGLHKVAGLLQSTLDEEAAEARELSGLADLVNSRAEPGCGALQVIS